QAQQESVVRVGGIVDAVLISQEGAEGAAELEQAMPLAVAAAQPTHLQAEDDAGVVHAHLGDHALKAVAFLGGPLAALSLVVVDDKDALPGPPQGGGVVGQGILALAGFAMMADLVGAGLPDIDQGEPLPVMGADLGGTWKWSGRGVVGLRHR